MANIQKMLVFTYPNPWNKLHQPISGKNLNLGDSTQHLQNNNDVQNQTCNAFGMVGLTTTTSERYQHKYTSTSISSAFDNTKRMPWSVFQFDNDEVFVHARVCRRPGRAILNQNQAREIFLCRPDEKSSIAVERARAAFLSRKYGVSVKTVRDIWIGRTWYRATFHLDPSKPIAEERLQRQPGRPKGAKDRQPRTRKMEQCVVDTPDDLSNLKPNSNLSAKSCKSESAQSAGIGAPIEFPGSCNGGFVGININNEGTAGSDDTIAHNLIIRMPADFPSRAMNCQDAHLIASDLNQLNMYPLARPIDARQASMDHASPQASSAQEMAVCQRTTPSVFLSSEFVDPFHNDWPFWPEDAPPCHADNAPEGSTFCNWAEEDLPEPATHCCQPCSSTPCQL